MSDVLFTHSGPLQKVQETNSTTAGTAVTQPADTLTSPLSATGALAAGVILMGGGGNRAPNGLFLKPYAVGNDNVTFLMAVFAMDRIIHKATLTPDGYTHSLLAAFTCTASAAVGVALGNVLATERYADTIVASVGNANVSHEVISPATQSLADVAGHVVVDCKGSEFVKVLFWMNSSATSANALFRRI